MTLSLDMDTLLASITSTASGITGVRKAYDYDEWPDSPPALYGNNQALHLTGFPEDWRYIARGMDLSEYEFVVPMYTLVLESAKMKRSRSWVAPFIDRYRAAFDTRTSILAVGTGNTGSMLYDGASVVHSITDWEDYDGHYMLRHRLACHVKGAVDRSS